MVKLFVKFIIVSLFLSFCTSANADEIYKDEGGVWRNQMPVRFSEVYKDKDGVWRNRKSAVPEIFKEKDGKRHTQESGNKTAENFPDQSSWATVTVIGDPTFTRNTHKALALIKNKSPKSYKIVSKYIGVIKQGAKSGMRAYDNPPAFVVGNATSQSTTTWYASCIVHDSIHSKLYHDYRARHSTVPEQVWTGEKAERVCLEFQIAFLKEIKAPETEIAHAKSVRKVDWWSEPLDW